LSLLLRCSAELLAHGHLHPFPTRRSSDLWATASWEICASNSSRICSRWSWHFSPALKLELSSHDCKMTSAGWPEFYRIRSLALLDRKSTRLNSSHVSISYAVFCLKKKKDS